MSSMISENFWKKPVFLPYVQYDLTDDMISNAEDYLGYKLPETYIKLLKIQNGGYTRFTIKGSPLGQCWGIGSNFPNILDNDWKRDDVEDFVSFPLEGLIPFDGDGHWYCCFDYRENNNEPKITFIDIECDEQQLVAENFDEFLAQLTLDIDDCVIAVLTDESLMTFKATFEKLFSIRFNPPSNDTSGYDVYTSIERYKDSCFFLYQNLVPFAFARVGDINFDKLADFQGKTAYIYPELQRNCMFIKHYNNDMIEEVINTLTKNDIQAYRLNELLD